MNKYAGVEDPSQLSTEERRHLAKGPDVKEEHQILLAHDKDTRTRKLLALQQCLSAGVQRALATDADEEVRADLAMNSSLLLELQEVLVLDPSVQVRGHLALNSTLTPETHLRLAHDSNRSVRWYLSQNSDATFAEGFPISCLDLSEKGAAFASAHLEEAGLNLEEVWPLRDGWAGTLEELVETAKEFAVAPAPAA